MAMLFIKNENGGPAWQVWPAHESIPSGSITEASSYLFELRESDEANSADLFIDDIPLEALRSKQPRVARWRWTPGFHAGSVEAVLKLPSTGVRRFEVVTDPDLRKLTRDEFDSMVREVLEDTYALFSLSAFRKGIASQRSNKPPPLARLEFIRSRSEEIISSILAIGRSPRHFLRAEQVVLPAHRAVRATGPEIVKSFRSGHIRSETSKPSRLPVQFGGRLPANIIVRQRRNSMDIPEHRQIKACLVSWSSWLMRVADALEKNGKKSRSETLSTAESWAARARRIARGFIGAARSGFMAEVGEGPAALQMTSLFRNDPVYNRFYRLWRDMNLGLAAVFGEFLQMPLARTYDLYELWCFLRLLRAAADEYGQTDLDLSGLFKPDSEGVTISSRSIVVSIGANKNFCFQRHYREYWVEPEGQGSFSRTMIPDVVLSGSGFCGQGRQLIVLDAKYRINEGLNDALSSIHTYRDALVQEVGGEIEGIVTAAYLLTPHAPTLGSDFKAMQVPGLLFHPQYREKFRFGAVTLRPGMKSEELRQVLRTIVADASEV